MLSLKKQIAAFPLIDSFSRIFSASFCPYLEITKYERKTDNVVPGATYSVQEDGEDEIHT